MNYECGVCSKRVQYDSIQCENCSKWIHRKCAELTKHELKYLGESNCMWFCKNCKHNIFPFSGLEDNELILLNENIPSNLDSLYIKCKHLSIDTITDCDKDIHFDNDIDPESNFYNRVDTSCEYLLDEQFTCKFKNIQGLSIIAFNTRSFNANFESIVVVILIILLIIICMSSAYEHCHTTARSNITYQRLAVIFQIVSTLAFVPKLLISIMNKHSKIK